MSKRGAGNQITKDDYNASKCGNEASEGFERASGDVLKKRRMIRATKKALTPSGVAGNQEEDAATSNPFKPSKSCRRKLFVRQWQLWQSVWFGCSCSASGRASLCPALESIASTHACRRQRGGSPIEKACLRY